jgi:hypothetical protein
VLLIAGMLAVVALGVAALLSIGRGSTGYSLAAAAEQTAAADTLTIDMTMTVGSMGEMTMRASVDQDAQLMTVTMDMGTLLGASAASGEPSGIEMIVDGAGGVIYVAAGALLDEIEGSPTWVSMGLEQLALLNGLTPDDLRGQLSMDPGASAQLLLDADADGSVTQVGVEEIDGEQLMHYQVTVRTADVMAATPQTKQQLDQLTAMGGVLPETIVYDVWVTEDDELRRIGFEMPVMNESMRVETTYRSIDEPLDVTIPSGSDVIEFADLMPS